MPRIVGVDVPNNKPTWIALTYIHGIGVHTSKKILTEAGIEKAVRAGKLTEDEVSRISQITRKGKKKTVAGKKGVKELR